MLYWMTADTCGSVPKVIRSKILTRSTIFISYKTDTPRRRTKTDQDLSSYFISDILRISMLAEQIEYRLPKPQFEPYTSGSFPPSTRVSSDSSSAVHFGLLASSPTFGMWLTDSLQELAECPAYAHDEDIAKPSDVAFAKAQQLLEEVSCYVMDRPDIYPMEERSIAIDFRRPESKSGVLFVIERDGSGALFHRTANSKGRLRVDDAANLLGEGGVMELKRVGIR